MKWKPLGFSQLSVGGSPVPIKTLYLKNKWDEKKRYRVRTAQDTSHVKSFSTPAQAQLAKDERNRIGALARGAHGEWIKIGKLNQIQPYIFVSLDALSKNVCHKLLIPLEYELIEEEGVLLAIEKEDKPYYIVSRRSKRFHHPGCPRAKRISDKNKITFATRKKALEAGYSPDTLCKP